LSEQEENKPQPYLDLEVLRERYKNGVDLMASTRLEPDLEIMAQAAEDINSLIAELTMLRKQSNYTSWLALREWDRFEVFVPNYPVEWAEQIKENPRFSLKFGEESEVPYSDLGEDYDYQPEQGE